MTDGFERFLAVRKYSHNTIKTYLVYEKVFLKDFINKDETMDQECINNFLLEHNSIPSRAFMKSYLKYINALNTFTIPQDLSKHRTKETKYLTKDEVYQLVNGIDNAIIGLQVLLLFESGLRVSEMFNLRWNEIDIFNRKGRVVVREGNKTGYRRFRFSDWTAKALANYANTYEPFKDGRIFEYYKDNPQKARIDFKDRLIKYSEEILGLHVTPHQLRHSCGFYLRKMGKPKDYIQKYLGHKRSDTTSIYTHVEDDEVQESIGELFK